MIELNNEDLNELINEGLVLIDFNAKWCGPCQMLAPIIENISKKYSNLKIIKIDTDKHPSIARNYGIMSIPTLLILKDGNIQDKNIGFLNENSLEELINKYM